MNQQKLSLRRCLSALFITLGALLLSSPSIAGDYTDFTEMFEEDDSVLEYNIYALLLKATPEEISRLKEGIDLLLPEINTDQVDSEAPPPAPPPPLIQQVIQYSKTIQSTTEPEVEESLPAQTKRIISPPENSAEAFQKELAKKLARRSALNDQIEAVLRQEQNTNTPEIAQEATVVVEPPALLKPAIKPKPKSRLKPALAPSSEAVTESTITPGEVPTIKQAWEQEKIDLSQRVKSYGDEEVCDPQQKAGHADTVVLLNSILITLEKIYNRMPQV